VALVFLALCLSVLSVAAASALNTTRDSREKRANILSDLLR
jgi:hypothetical protein